MGEKNIKYLLHPLTILLHNIITFSNLIRSVFILANRFQNKTAEQTQKCIDQIILSADDQRKISSIALEKVEHEYLELEHVTGLICYSNK